MIHRPSLQIDGIDPIDKQQFEQAAAALNLSPAAYLKYLMSRPYGEDAARLDRHVREVFGRYGKTMRKLAE